MFTDIPPIYCLSFQNPWREKKMKDMFQRLGLLEHVHMYEGVQLDDSRILGRAIDNKTKRTWSMCYGHLDMIGQFINSNENIGIFCEDDILIRNDFGTYLPQLVSHFQEFYLEIMLFGFLCDNDFRNFSNFPEKNISLCCSREPDFPFRYYDYSTDPESAVWGTQMYMLSREHALELYDKYAYDYADQTITNSVMTPFSSDWIITKTAENRALVYPLIVIEDGQSEYADVGQNESRIRCFAFSYKEELFGPILREN
jgi:hypothetical protein